MIVGRWYVQLAALVSIYIYIYVVVCSFVLSPHWGTADADITVPSVENPELTNVLRLKPGVGQNIAMHASPTARNFFLGLISTFPVHSP